MTAIDDLKRRAAEKAVTSVQSGMVVGLGTGSTAIHATRAIGRLLQDGTLQQIVAVATSQKTAAAARNLKIPLVTLDSHPQIDITIDGADEVDSALRLIKGLGGALLREKIVAAASRQMIVVADHSKQVTQLGSKAPVPVEIIPFAQRPLTDKLTALGAQVVLRRQENNSPFVTDESNYILDCAFGPIPDPAALAQAIIQLPGVVEHGLFLGLATRAIIASPDGIASYLANQSSLA